MCVALTAAAPLERVLAPQKATTLESTGLSPRRAPVDPPDPAAPKMTWVHWVLYNIPPTATRLAEAVEPDALPEGTREGKNDWKRTGYGGPCPPIGRHRYFFKLYALDVVLPDLKTPTKAQLEKAMEGHILAKAELMGTYQKARG